MKKVLFTMAFVAAAFFCQAQLFVGGSLGFGSGGGTTEGKVDNLTITEDLPKTSSFLLAPNVGFMFSEQLGVGMSFGYYTDKLSGKDGDVTVTYKTPGWYIAPYLRYVFGDFDNVQLYADLKLSIGGRTEKYNGKMDNTSVDGDNWKESITSIYVAPGIAYYLSDNISINARVNLLTLGYSMTKTTEFDLDDSDYKEVTKANNFGFGINNPTALEVGFFYTF